MFTATGGNFFQTILGIAAVVEGEGRRQVGETEAVPTSMNQPGFKDLPSNLIGR